MKLVKLNKDMIVGGIPRVKGQLLTVKDNFTEGTVLKENVEDKAVSEYKKLEVKPPKKEEVISP